MSSLSLEIPEQCPVCYGGPIRLESGLDRSYPLRQEVFVTLDLRWDIPVCRSCASVATTIDGGRLLARGLRSALWRQVRANANPPTATDLAYALVAATREEGAGQAVLSYPWREVALDHLAERQEHGFVPGDILSEEAALEWGERLLSEIEEIKEGEAAPFRLPGAFDQPVRSLP